MTDDERIWRCSCGGPHFLTVRRWDNNDPGYFLVNATYGGNLGERVRQAVKHVLGRGHGDAWVELCLDPKTLRELRDHLSSLLGEPQVQVTYSTLNRNTGSAIPVRKTTGEAP